MKSSLNILYVGNETRSLETIKYHGNCTLTVLSNNLSAVNYLNAHRHPDAIICDYNLPGSNGMFLFDWVRGRTQYDRTSFILLEQEFNKDNFKLAFRKQVDDYYVTSSSLTNDLYSRIEFLNEFRNKTDAPSTLKSFEKAYKLPLSKRIFDVFLSSIVLLMASPFLLIIMLAIRLESKGQVYYTAKRVGRKTFDFYKLRSMRAGSDALLKTLAKENNQYGNTGDSISKEVESSCPKCALLPDDEICSTAMFVDTNQICEYWYNYQQLKAAENSARFVKISNDPRVTRIGKFIRNTSIDELPQLINVLKGDMSIVGNRPLPVYEAEFLTVDTLSKRFLAPAGITGLWQVELRGKGGDMSEAERMKLDNEYADHFEGNNYSFWYDIKLIMRTIPALIQKDTV